MSQKKNLLVPYITVFLSSGFIMTLELVASRLIARFLGSSLYTWTAVIGIVLTGITIGNYLGGRLADKYNPKKTLTILFFISSITSVFVVVLNNMVGNWEFLDYLDLIVRIFVHVTIIFIVPSTFLGMIGPVVAKMALDQGMATGKTVGRIYAWGTAGSIFGTFLTGYYLIATFGTVEIIWSLSAMMLIMSLYYGISFKFSYVWLVFLLSGIFLSSSSQSWATNFAVSCYLKAPKKDSIIYEDETPYCYVFVEQESKEPDTRKFLQDTLIHSKVNMDDKDNFLYFYGRIYRSVMEFISEEKESLSALCIGGGGYVFPAYMERRWPGSQIDVAEIDPGVTKAAKMAFGLSEESSINTIQRDARNIVDDLYRDKMAGKQVQPYDFILGDAINSFTVPFQLTTHEFNGKVKELLDDDGVYMFNMIDVFLVGEFLGAVIHTLQQTFDHVYVLMDYKMIDFLWDRQTFVVVCSKKPIDISAIIAKNYRSDPCWILSQEQLEFLEQKGKHLTLTDNYAPVDNLLSKVYRLQKINELASAMYINAVNFMKNSEFDRSIEYYRYMMEMNPDTTVMALNNIATILVSLGDYNKAVKTFQDAIEYNRSFGYIYEQSRVYLNLGVTLLNLQRQAEARTNFNEVIFQTDKILKDNFYSPNTHNLKAQALVYLGLYDKAEEHYKRGMELKPDDFLRMFETVDLLRRVGNNDLAKSLVQYNIDILTREDNAKAAEKFVIYLNKITKK